MAEGGADGRLGHDTEGYSTDMSDTRRNQRRAGVAVVGSSGGLGLAFTGDHFPNQEALHPRRPEGDPLGLQGPAACGTVVQTLRLQIGW